MGELPQLRTLVPGPRSRELARELRLYESPNVTYVDEGFPVFWESASGCMVQDVDGNVFLDLTSAFGVAAAGHSHPRVVAAIREQAGALIHGMGDVHPSARKVELARRLAQMTPGRLQQVIFGCNGSDAVEAALKTAMMFTGKPGILAFEGGYHGLGYGALDATSRDHFRTPFTAQLGGFTRRVPFPNPYRNPFGPTCSDPAGAALERVDEVLHGRETDGPEIGAVLVEPIQGRAGIIVPAAGWFTELSALCRQHGVLLIADEIFTGLGRTGTLFASETPPDLMCIGKILGGGLPVSACIGTPEVMASWGESTGEAIHTSTFLGNPLACAAALAVLDLLDETEMLRQRDFASERLLTGLREIQHRRPVVGEVRGRGLMLGIELIQPGGASDPGAAVTLMKALLQRGILALPAGPQGSVLEIVPPFIIDERQIDFALAALGEALSLTAE